MTIQEVSQLFKAHCMIEFGQAIQLDRLVFMHGRWEGVARSFDPGLGAWGLPFGFLISAEGEVLEDALDTDDE